MSSLEELKYAVSCKGAVVEVDRQVDLEHEQIEFAEKVILVLNAKLLNGTIVGNNTQIKATIKPVFENISFKGTFSGQPLISWFKLVTDERIDNAPEINSALQLTALSSIKVLVLPKDGVFYVRSDIDYSKWRDFLRAGTIEIKSGVTLDMNGSTIQCLPNASHQYNILFARQADHISIKNGTIRGDCLSHTGASGEWGYGIELQGVSNFLLENLECSYCWGDGIDIQVSDDGDGVESSRTTQSGHCREGIINNVYCHDNLRQGMSVQGVIGLIVRNSRFSFSKGKNPQSGVDIEPYTSKNIVAHVYFDNCVFDNNYHSGLVMSGNSLYDITIKNCVFYGNGGWELSLQGKNIRVKGCHGREGYRNPTVRILGDSKDILISNSDLSSVYAQGFVPGKHVNDVVFKSCNFAWMGTMMSSGFSDDESLSSCDIKFNRCLFDFQTGLFSDGNIVYQPNNENYQYYYQGCTFNMGGQRARLTNSQVFYKCVFNDCSSCLYVASHVFTNHLLLRRCKIVGLSRDSFIYIYSPDDGAIIKADLQSTKFIKQSSRGFRVFSSSKNNEIEVIRINREYKNILTGRDDNIVLR